MLRGVFMFIGTVQQIKLSRCIILHCGVYCVQSIVCGFPLKLLEVQCVVMQISMDICGSL